MISFQPDSADIYERVVEQSREQRWAMLRAAVPAVRTGKRVSPAPGVLPFLVFEDGLGMLTPFVANVYDLLDGRGRDWMGKRGTYEAVERGLAFLGLTATTEAADHRRAWWNSTQLRFPDLPADDSPLLGRIEGIMQLSLPFRQDFRRGVHEYDIPAAEGDHTRLDGCLLDCESGIRLPGGTAVWSFGRSNEFEHTLDRGEGDAIGNWVDLPENGGLSWSEMTYPWSTATFAWSDNPDAQRRKLMASWFNGRLLYLKLMDGNGNVLGYRRVKSSHAVSPSFDGLFVFGGEKYSKSPDGQVAYVEFMTDFDDFDGVELAAVEIVSDVVLAHGVKPGKALIRPDEVVKQASFPSGRFWMGAADFPSFAYRTITLPLRRTVRERFKFLVRF